MISNEICVVQDQLVSSKAPGKIRVRYPRGAQTTLGFDNTGVITIEGPDADGSYQQGTILPNGNVLYLSDQPDSVPTLVLGAGLVGL